MNALTKNYWPIPDNKLIKVFKGILDKWPNCPICGARYGYNDYSVPANRMTKMLMFCPKSEPQHFICKFNEDPKIYKKKKYIKRRATFSIQVRDYSIEYDTNIRDSDKVKVIKKMARNAHMLKLPFVSLDKWFVPHDRLVENLDKLFILL